MISTGIPIPIVAISVGIAYEQYGDVDKLWGINVHWFMFKCACSAVVGYPLKEERFGHLLDLCSWL